MTEFYTHCGTERYFDFDDKVCDEETGKALTVKEIVDVLNELHEKNKELKAKVDNKEVAVEVECEKLMQKVFNAIDEKIDELEKRYKFGQEVYKGCPMHNIRFGINTLKELKKELYK